MNPLNVTEEPWCVSRTISDPQQNFKTLDVSGLNRTTTRRRKKPSRDVAATKPTPTDRLPCVLPLLRLLYLQQDDLLNGRRTAGNGHQRRHIAVRNDPTGLRLVPRRRTSVRRTPKGVAVLTEMRKRTGAENTTRGCITTVPRSGWRALRCN